MRFLLLALLSPVWLWAEGGTLDRGAHVITLTCLSGPTAPVTGSRGIYCDSTDGRLRSVAPGGGTVDLEASGGGGSTPTGTGFRHVTGGVEDGAAALLTDADIPDTISLTNLTQIGTRAISDTTGTLSASRGGTGVTSTTDDTILVANGSALVAVALPSCSNATTSKLLYDTATNAFSCGTDQSAAGGPTTLVSSSTASDAVIATMTAIPGISFSAAASTNYLIDCSIIYTSTVTTTGITFAWNTPASPTRILMTGSTTISAAGGSNGYLQRADDTPVSVTTGVNAITVEQMAVLHTLFQNGSTAGTTTLGFTPETANSVSVVQGSVCQYRTF